MNRTPVLVNSVAAFMGVEGGVASDIIKTQEKRKSQAISLMNLNARNFNEILANQIQEHIKKAIHRDHS